MAVKGRMSKGVHVTGKEGRGCEASKEVARMRDGDVTGGRRM